MKVLEKLFFGIDMKWWKVIVFAVVTGVLAGVIMMIPALEQTSIHNIGVTMESWVLFAMIICSNCVKPLEAAVKTFVFFLVSQPLVYLTMWPVYECFPWHYYMYWFYWTIASFFCALLAWYVRRQNIGSALVVTLINALLLFLGATFLKETIINFPFGLLTTLFCVAQAVVYIVVLLKPRRERLIAAVLSVVIAVGALVGVTFAAPSSLLGYSFENASECTFVLADPTIVEVEAEEDSLSIRALAYGATDMTITYPDGHTEHATITVEPDGHITYNGQ